jgi:hypothetical protein
VPNYTEQDERDARVEMMLADTQLKLRQAWWEAPKAIATMLAAVAVIVGLVAGLAGYKLGSQQPQSPTVIVVPSGATTGNHPKAGE